MPVEIKNSQTYLAELTGLRGIAAIWVAIFHMRYNYQFASGFYDLFFSARWLQKAYLAVDVFFILSGFVMAHSSRWWTGDAIFSFWKNFIRRRIARIYPLHVFSLGLVIVYLVCNSRLAANWFPAFLAHLTMVHAWGFKFEPDFNFASWSISCEWAAYLIFPFMLVLNRKTCGRVAQNFLAIFVGAIALSLFAYIYNSSRLDMTWNFGLLRCLCEFWIGLSIYQLNRSLKLNEKTPQKILLVTLISLICFLTFEVADLWILPIATTLIFCLLRSSKLSAAIFANKPIHFLGDISYSVYMLHVPVGLTFLKYWAEYFGPEQSTLMGATALVCAMSVVIVCSTFAYYKIELPLRTYLGTKATTGPADQKDQLRLSA